MKLRIKEICKDKGITITELASRIDIHQESLSRIIAKNSTSTNNLQKIADALGVPVSDLFDEQKGNVFQCPKCGTTLVVKEN